MSFLFRHTRKMRWSIPLFALTLVCAGCTWTTLGPVPAAMSEEAEFYRPYFQSQLLMAEGETNKALEILQELSTRRDCPPEVLKALADAHMQKRAVDDAVRVLTDAIAKYPQYIPALEERARIYRLRDQNELAIADLETALKLMPNQPDLLETLGMILMRQLSKTTRITELQSADSAASKLVDVYSRLAEIRSGNQRVLPLLVLATVHSKLDRHEEAIAAAREAVKINPRDIRTHLALAEALEAKGDSRGALDSYRQAMLIEPTNASLQQKMAQLINTIGEPGGLLGFYEDMSESFPRIREIQEAYGLELTKAEKWKEATEHYTEVLKLWPNDKTFLSRQVQAYLAQGDLATGLRLTRDLLNDDSISAEELVDLAGGLPHKEHPETAIEMLDLLADHPNADLRILTHLARVQIELGKTSEAIKTLERLVEQEPDYFLGIALLGELYTAEKRFGDAYKLFDAAGEQVNAASQDRLKIMKAQLLSMEGKDEPAEELLVEVMEASKENREQAFRLLVEIRDAQNDFTGAHKAADRYLEIAEGSAAGVVAITRAYLYNRQSNLGDKDALKSLEELSAANGNEFTIGNYMVDAYLKQERYNDALATIDRIAPLVDQRYEGELQVLRARVYRGKGDLTKAIALLEALSVQHRTVDRYYLLAGEYFHEAGRTTDAERMMRKAIEVNPENAETYNALGYFFAEAGVKLDEALELVQKALEMRPGQGHILDSLGWVYYKKGRYEDAIQALEDAVDKMSDSPDPVVLEHLGDAYKSNGQTSKAQKAWQRAYDLDPENGELKSKLDEAR